MTEFEHACDKIRMGAERKSAVISPENLKLTAYHEGGHALVALKTAGGMPIHKVAVEPTVTSNVTSRLRRSYMHPPSRLSLHPPLHPSSRPPSHPSLRSPLRPTRHANRYATVTQPFSASTAPAVTRHTVPPQSTRRRSCRVATRWAWYPTCPRKIR